jgi:hypothetical protein
VVTAARNSGTTAVAAERGCWCKTGAPKGAVARRVEAVGAAARTGRVLGRIGAFPGSIVMLEMERLLAGILWTPGAPPVVGVFTVRGAAVATNVLGGAGITDT